MHSVKWCKDWAYSLHLNKCCLTPHYHAHQDSCQSQYSLESLILLCITDQCPWSLLWTLGWLVHVWLFTYPVTTKDTISWSTYLDHIPSMWCWLILTLCFLKCFLQNSYMLPCFLLPSVRYYLAQLKGKIKILVRLWKTPFWLDSGNSKKMVKADSFYICFSSFPTILTLSSICFFLYYYVKSITLWNHQFTT